MRAVASLCGLTRKRKSLSLLAAVLLLLNAAVPYWHAAQKLQAETSAYADPEARQDSPAFGGAECHQDSAAQEQHGSRQAPASKRGCPLCQALQLFSPGAAPPVSAFIPCAPHAVAAALPRPAELKAPGHTAGQSQPRAPPLA